MARKHLLAGLMEWVTREEWRDRFEEVLEFHVLPACDDTGLEPDEIVSILGEDMFMRTVWACAFEDMLTREFGDGSNIVDDYLKHRGSKEPASTRAYITALRNSVMSLYEVSDVVLDKSFRARDLVRGGEPILISERLATRFLKQWDRFAGRVLQVGGRTQISGAVLPYEHQSSEELVDGLRRLGKLSKKDEQALARSIGEEFDAAAIARLSETERLRATSPTFTSMWLVDAIDQAQRDLPELRNFDGDELLLCTICYPLDKSTTEDEIRRVLNSCADLRSITATQWNWIGGKKRGRKSARARSSESLTVETSLDDGALSLGHLELDGRTLVLSVNSRERSERGRALLSAVLGKRIGQPSIEATTVEQALASGDADEPEELDLSEEEHRAIIHETMDRHYRETLDEPVPALGNKSPRAAVKTKSGRAKVVDWLKMMENRTAKAGESNPAMASYSFDWIWAELGVAELRR
ncbi:hypothetical protein [Bradyrhizobium sp. LMTR 3]|uniref:hypothetical protein n=1 Tax=Bradyrhizobium sp. LMTR 3 TaxID=189873 RepID=UPI0008109271|nr:hypothetical protein [Bradyrhizobium sp. LMTR 3]OCK61593.1 hypothetical protein LMTR3_03450 [Bradyrhizobium sp. LMTR 3]